MQMVNEHERVFGHMHNFMTPLPEKGQNLSLSTFYEHYSDVF